MRFVSGERSVVSEVNSASGDERNHESTKGRKHETKKKLESAPTLSGSLSCFRFFGFS
jgi:hypothetical protein